MLLLKKRIVSRNYFDKDITLNCMKNNFLARKNQKLYAKAQPCPHNLEGDRVRLSQRREVFSLPANKIAVSLP